MTAGEWAAFIAAIAGVVVGLSAVTTTQRRKDLKVTSVVLLITAVIIAAITTMVRFGRVWDGATAQSPSLHPISPPENTRTEAPSPPSVTSSMAPTPTQPLIRRQSGVNSIRLSSDTAVDLDSMEPNWNVSKWPYGGGDADLEYSHGEVGEYGGGPYYPVGGEGSYAVCQAATAQTRFIRLNDRGNATEFCLWTSEGRLTFVKVVDVHDPVAFDVIVWEKS